MGHFDPTTSESFRGLASPGHCQWWCVLEKHRGINGRWKPRCEVAAPRKVNDVADVVLTHNPLHAHEQMAKVLQHLSSLG